MVVAVGVEKGVAVCVEVDSDCQSVAIGVSVRQ